MKINEIIYEDMSAEDQLGDNEEGTLTSNLMPVLMFLRKRSEDKELSPKLHTDSLIQLVQNAGDTTFDYNALVDAVDSNDAVRDLIADFNEDEITLKSDSESAEEKHTDIEKNKPEDAEKVVARMAKKASKNRE